VQNNFFKIINSGIDSRASDSTQKKAIKVSLIFTLILWLILFVFFAISPAFKTQEKYKTVKIVLEPVSKDSVKDEKKESSAAVKKNAPAESKKTAVEKNDSSKKSAAEKQPSQEKKQPAKTVKSENQNQVKKTQPQENYKKSSYTIKKDLEQSWQEQTSAKKKSYTADDFDSMFEKSTVTSSSSNNNQAPSASSSVPKQSALQGTAGILAESANSPVVASSAETTSAQSSVSESTVSSLGKIVAAVSSSSGEISAAPFSSSSRSSDGKVSVKLADGSSRLLIEPKEPVIKISSENASLIDSSRTVLIAFRILASGNIPSSGIIFKPSAAIPEPIQSEIKEQISRWRFEQAKNDGQAGFEYSIILR